MKERLDRGQPLYLATLAALLGSGIVSAAETAPVTAGDNGLMHFPNVRVEHAPQPARTGTTATTEAGVRAYIDPATRQLRAPLPEELARERERRRRAGLDRAEQNADDHQRTIVTGDGIGAKLDQSHEVFFVVRRQPSGELEELCIVGEDAARNLVEAQTPPATPLTTRRSRDER